MGKQEKKTYREVKEDLKDRYQAWKVMAIAGYVNGKDELLAKNIIEEVAKNMGFITSYFATIVLTEGLGFSYLDFDYNFTANPRNVRNDIIVKGYQLGGVDDFGFHYEDRYKKYLPDSFNEGFSTNDLKNNGAEFIKIYQKNEKSEDIVTADFSNMESLIWACGATLAHRRDLFLKESRALGYLPPSEDELAYWTYMYYQGEGRAYKALLNNKGLDIFGISSRNAPGRTVTKGTRNPNDVALSNLASWRYLQWANIFSE